MATLRVLTDPNLLTHILQHDPYREHALAQLKTPHLIALRAECDLLRKELEPITKHKDFPMCRNSQVPEKVALWNSYTTLRKKEETISKEIFKEEVDWCNVIEDRVIWRIALMKECKAVCKLWCNVCRAALTDPVWCSVCHTVSPYSEKDTMHLQLPLECTLNPQIFSEDLTDGFFGGRYAGYIDSTMISESHAGNPFNSVTAVLHDLKVWVKVKNDADNNPNISELLITDIELTIDGQNGIFNSVDSIWSLLDSHFRISLEDKKERQKYNDYITFGERIRGKYWLHHADLVDLLYKEILEQEIFLRRPDGSSCIQSCSRGWHNRPAWIHET